MKNYALHSSRRLVSVCAMALLALSACSSGAPSARIISSVDNSSGTDSSGGVDQGGETGGTGGTGNNGSGGGGNTPGANPGTGGGNPTGPTQGESAGICDPFNDDWDPDRISTRTGLFAKLSYVPNGTTEAITKVDDVFRLGIAVEANIFFNSVNVPTRNFTAGFGTPGNELKDRDGNKLTAFFALNMDTQLGLPRFMEPGYYQLLLISDDGALLTINENGQKSVLVDNDGTHSTRSSCASRALYLDATSAHQLNLAYHQGPPDRIAVVMMWRKVAGPQADASNPLCNTTNDMSFFAADSSSPYQGLKTMGFTEVPPEAFTLPAWAPTRICQY